jgi:protein-disulfide isomerase
MPAVRFTTTISALALLFSGSAALAQNSTPVDRKQPLATVGGQPVYEEDLNPSVNGQLLQLRNQEYQVKKSALDDAIDNQLLEAEAKKKGITTDELLKQEVDAKIQPPDDSELQGFYVAQRDRLNKPFSEVKEQLRQTYMQAEMKQRRQEYTKKLRERNNIAILLAPPKVQVAYDAARLRGNPNAPVIIVEFSDYECPYCRQVEPTVKQLLAKYRDQVRISYRDFPLTAIHPQAMIAAEASRCALEQGKYWEYHDQLFAASKLEKDSLVEYARNLKLDDKQFEICLTSEKYKADIEKDTQEGRKAGVNGTPGFFINGISLSGAQGQDAFARVIDDELGRKSNRPTATVTITRAER